MISTFSKHCHLHTSRTSTAVSNVDDDDDDGEDDDDGDDEDDNDDDDDDDIKNSFCNTVISSKYPKGIKDAR